jgi:hypothetical protein
MSISETFLLDGVTAMARMSFSSVCEIPECYLDRQKRLTAKPSRSDGLSFRFVR